MKKILLIAGLSESYYFEPFVNACLEKQVKIYILDKTLFPKHATLSVSLDKKGSVQGFIDVLEQGVGVAKEVRLQVSEIDTAWHLRDGVLNSEQAGRTLEERFAENETSIAIRSFLSTLQCKWVNKKEVIDSLSSNKLYQQKLAAEVGLTTPDTLISNNPRDVIDFSEHRNGLLLKQLGYIRLDDKGEYFLYSNRFSHEEIRHSPEAIRSCPIFAQEYVEKRFEYRVMVIGDRVLACQIDSQASEATKVDWRHYDFENVAHTQINLPKGVQEKLLKFMERADLRYGAIDMIETPNGEFVFLEINPSGQWGWIADLAELPIPEAVAEMLEAY